MKDRKGQVSAELIIVIAAVLAVSLVFVTQLQKTAKTGAETMSERAEGVFSEINNTALCTYTKSKGRVCSVDCQCISGDCVSGKCK